MVARDTDMTIKAVIFDCFGVLYLDARQSMSVQYPQKQEQLKDLNHQADYGFLSRSEYLQAVSEATQQTPEVIEQFIHDEHRLNRALLGEIVNLRGAYKIGLLSNIGRGWMDDFFDTHQLHEYFDAVVVSGDEGITKPHPRIYEIMAERLGLETHECVMIDDIEANCAGADAAGMRSIHYRDNEQLRNDLQQLHIL